MAEECSQKDLKSGGPFSAMNGKLWRDGATARQEVTPVQARDALNALLAASKRLLASMDDYDGNTPASLDSPYDRMRSAIANVEGRQ